ncbi:MAG: carbohydrate ABC transporter permease [Bacillota bacterium]
MAKLTPKEKFAKVGINVFIIFYLIITFFPMYWMVVNSLKNKLELGVTPPTLFTLAPTFASYVLMFVKRMFARLILNSVIVATLTSIICLVVGLPAAYSLSRMHIPKRISRGISLSILVSKTLPPIAFVIPLFLIFSKIHIIGTYASLIIPYVALNLPFMIWLVKGILDDTAVDIEEAAMMDGDSRFAAFRKITIPNIVSALFAASILVFIFSWNEFLFAVIFTNTWKTMTLPMGVWGTLSQYEFTWDKTSAAASIAIIPVIIFAFAIRKYLIKGLTMNTK